MEWKTAIPRSLDLTEATTKLLEEQESRFSGNCDGEGIRTDMVRVASLQPVEDDLSCGTMDVGSGKSWLYWGVYDGHSGWFTSKILASFLTKYVSRKLAQLPESVMQDLIVVEEAIKSAFLELDNEILSNALAALHEPISHAEAISRLGPASSGSCALLAMYDPRDSMVRVASAGDSRAVLGRPGFRDSSSWTCIPLSTDHTGLDPGERERILAEHPGEENLISPAGRLLGSAVTRSFGDNRWKWTLEELEDWRGRFFGRTGPRNIKSPPYLTALPTVTMKQVHPGDFLILASDGFWNHMSSDDAVHCVSLWVDTQKRIGLDVDTNTNTTAGIKYASASTTKESGPCEGYPYNWIVKRENFIVEDDNVATHLVRNAFGGKDRNLFCSVLSTIPPEAKEARDDVTVVVVMF
ncbi:protein serine/threonine phosphatase 2C [Aspergillus pseudonomiae]|nr:protein serine/threonine phosphatase 2C [Aspergillus pseudonomiae]